MSLYDPDSMLLKVYSSITLEPTENWIFLSLMCFTGGSLDPFITNREPLAIGEATDLINAFTGQTYLEVAAGEDWIWKGILLTFTEPVLIEILTTFGGVLTYYVHLTYQLIPMTPMLQHINIPFSAPRSLFDAITTPNRSRISVTNRGNAPASGTVWFVGKTRRGAFKWY